MVICHVACVCRFVLAWPWQCLFASTRSRWWYVDLPADETAKGRLCYDRGTQLDKWAIPNEILVDLIASGATKLAWSTERCHPSYTANLPKHVYSIFLSQRCECGRHLWSRQSTYGPGRSGHSLCHVSPTGIFSAKTSNPFQLEVQTLDPKIPWLDMTR
jgi:hypothetical protein